MQNMTEVQAVEVCKWGNTEPEIVGGVTGLRRVQKS